MELNSREKYELQMIFFLENGIVLWKENRERCGRTFLDLINLIAPYNLLKYVHTYFDKKQNKIKSISIA